VVSDAAGEEAKHGSMYLDCMYLYEYGAMSGGGVEEINGGGTAGSGRRDTAGGGVRKDGRGHRWLPIDSFRNDLLDERSALGKRRPIASRAVLSLGNESRRQRPKGRTTHLRVKVPRSCVLR
jgi:hypothetical protein